MILNKKKDCLKIVAGEFANSVTNLAGFTAATMSLSRKTIDNHEAPRPSSK